MEKKKVEDLTSGIIYTKRELICMGYPPSQIQNELDCIDDNQYCKSLTKSDEDSKNLINENEYKRALEKIEIYEHSYFIEKNRGNYRNSIKYLVAAMTLSEIYNISTNANILLKDIVTVLSNKKKYITEPKRDYYLFYFSKHYRKMIDDAIDGSGVNLVHIKADIEAMELPEIIKNHIKLEIAEYAFLKGLDRLANNFIKQVEQSGRENKDIVVKEKLKHMQKNTILYKKKG